jgi:hypothetical protein
VRRFTNTSSGVISEGLIKWFGVFMIIHRCDPYNVRRGKPLEGCVESDRAA